MPPLLASILPASMIGVGAAPTLAAAGTAFAPWVLPAALGAGSIGAGMIQGQMAQKAVEKGQKGALQTWQQTAYPSQAAVEAAATESRGTLGQARLGAYQNLASQLAARGFGAGSGLMATGGRNIESGYLQALGRTGTELTKFKETPMFGPPSGAYPSPVTGALEAGMGTAGSMLDKAMGYYMTEQMLKRLIGAYRG